MSTLLLLSLPLLATVLLALGMSAGVLQGQGSERSTATVARSMAVLCVVVSGWNLYANAGATTEVLRQPWLSSGGVHLDLVLLGGGIHGWLALLFSVLLLLVLRFSTSYLHKEAGFHRFFLLLCLFSFSMLLLVTAGNAVLTFVAWELAGLCSWLLIAFNYRREQAAANATRVFIIQRVGDAAFLLGIMLLLLWTGTDNWLQLASNLSSFTALQANLLALCFVFAAVVKSAQFPFTPWLFRAMEGPTPSSTVFYGSVMVHAGVYLLLLLEPLFEAAPFAKVVLLTIGVLTALFGWLTGKTQADIKTSLACSTATQLGLMFVACGLGWWELAFWHLCGHAVLRCFLFLSSPSILHYGHTLPVPPVQAPAAWLQQAALQQFWLDPLLDSFITRPVQRMATDLQYFEHQVLDPLMGTPAPVVRRMSQLLQDKEHSIGARLDSEQDSFAQGSGLAGKLTGLVAAISNWFENRFILQGVGRDMISLGRRLGHAANRFELLLLRPRYLVLFVFITLLIAM